MCNSYCATNETQNRYNFIKEQRTNCTFQQTRSELLRTEVKKTKEK